MPLEPRIPKRHFQTKTCAKCKGILSTEDFTQTHSIFYPDGYLPICNTCIDGYLESQDYTWDSIDKVCQWADLPFIVKEWERIRELNNNSNHIWGIYARVFADNCYEKLGWEDYHKQYLQLREASMIDEEIPLLHEDKMNKLREEWGANYDDNELLYLENLYKGLLLSQNVNGALQVDQARKICKISLEIDSRIRSGEKDVDKFLSAYDKLVKIAEFTPKNIKNAVDFDSAAEVGYWLEKRGRQNHFYDGTTRDVIDETLKNIENYNQRLYINEGGIGDEITARIKSLQTANKMEDEVFNLRQEYDLDEYDNSGFTDEQEDFKVEVDINGDSDTTDPSAQE